jgi:hypothetical protein
MKNPPGKLIEAEDGSGDWILEFTPEFLEENDWREGDSIDIDMVDGKIVLRNSTKKERDEGTDRTVS